MTPFGAWSAAVAAAALALGVVASWTPVVTIGAGILLAWTGSALFVAGRPRISVGRQVDPPKVAKGRPARAVIDVTNPGGRSLAPITFHQRLGGSPIPLRLPRLRPGEHQRLAYDLPTSVRGVLELAPVEVPRADPFGFFSTVQRFGGSQTLSVHPRLLPVRPLPTGTRRTLEGPTSDSAPQGTVAFHRVREYAVGDDLRMIHWPSTARAGRLVVRHHVDTAQPYSVVLLDLSPSQYSAETFEEAVDVAASVAVALAAGRAPVQLRTTAAARVGGPAWRDPAAIVDFLTSVAPHPEGDLGREVRLLARERGGTAAVVVTGVVTASGLAPITALRRGFDRVIAVSMAAGPGGAPAVPGVEVVVAGTAAAAALRWNTAVAR